MGPTDILQPEQRVESLTLVYSFSMLGISYVIHKFADYPSPKHF